MKIQQKGLLEKRIALGITGLNFLMLVSAFVLGIAVFRKFLTDSPINIVNSIFMVVAVIVYTVIAMLVISRYPKHILGWLFLIVGFFQALNGLGNVLDYSQQFISYSGFGSVLAFWLGGFWIVKVAWLPAQFIPITFVLQFFPDGHLPSRRWWPVPVVTLVLLVIWGIDELNISPGLEKFFGTYEIILVIPMVFSIVGTLLALIFRFRRSRGKVRTQMKWLVYTALTGILISLGFIISGVDNLVFDAFFLSLPNLLAISIGIAILMHRLWDIDVIIRRTMQYTLLTGLLALVYFVSVIALQSLIEKLTGKQSPLAIVFSTLVIAALFNPFRTRIQNFIDRRFYRKKYDAGQALAQFAATARDVVEIDKLTAALIMVVDETVQPEETSLWLSNEEDLRRNL